MKDYDTLTNLRVARIVVVWAICLTVFNYLTVSNIFLFIIAFSAAGASIMSTLID